MACEDFEPEHTLEIGYKVLLRLYLTPRSAGSLRSPEAKRAVGIDE